MRVVGLDLSLTATGYAVIETGAEPIVGTLKTNLKGYPRLEWVQNQIGLIVWPGRDAPPDLVMVEEPAWGGVAGQKGHHERGGLWWLITWQLWRGKAPTVLMNPLKVKQYATGSTGADKDAMMLATARRFSWFAGDNNAADALWLASAGADHLGVPLVQMPAAHRAALDKITWPEVA